MNTGKPKLSIQKQIEYMKDSQGVKFVLITESEAEAFLTHNNYYFRLKAYAKNYDQFESGRYMNLDFAYLKELSILDMHFWELILKITINIEHYLKVQLLQDFQKNEAEDGYAIISAFFQAYPDLPLKIQQQGGKGSYSKDLITKYFDHFSLWNILEILTFGDFINLYRLYYQLYPSRNDMSTLLWSCRIMRNAAAHNNCLLNTMKKGYSQDRFQINKELYRAIATNCPSISKKSRTKKLNNPVIHDFLVVIHLFSKVVTSQSIRSKTLAELKRLTHHRCIRNRRYFRTNTTISSSYLFVRQVLDFYYK